MNSKSTIWFSSWKFEIYFKVAHVYKTEGIILKKRDSGEADKVFSFFTKDFGRIEAMAQGVRHLKAKLRYSLSGLSFVRLGFVSTAKDYWRLVDAEEILVLENVKDNRAKLKSFSSIIAFTERFIQGQETDVRLWEMIKSGLLFLEKARDLNEKDLKTLELLAACRLLWQLGYLENFKKIETMNLYEANTQADFLASAAEKAITASQL